MSNHLTPFELNELLDAALPVSLASAAKKHLLACSACTEAYAGLSAAATAFSHVRTPHLYANFNRRVLAELSTRPYPLSILILGILGATSAVWMSLLILGAVRLLNLPSVSQCAPILKMWTVRSILWAYKAAPILDLVGSSALRAIPLNDFMQKLYVAAFLAAPIIVSLTRKIKPGRTWRTQ